MNIYEVALNHPKLRPFVIGNLGKMESHSSEIAEFIEQMPEIPRAFATLDDKYLYRKLKEGVDHADVIVDRLIEDMGYHPRTFLRDFPEGEVRDYAFYFTERHHQLRADEIAPDFEEFEGDVMDDRLIAFSYLSDPLPEKGVEALKHASSDRWEVDFMRARYGFANPDDDEIEPSAYYAALAYNGDEKARQELLEWGDVQSLEAIGALDEAVRSRPDLINQLPKDKAMAFIHFPSLHQHVLNRVDEEDSPRYWRAVEQSHFPVQFATMHAPQYIKEAAIQDIAVVLTRIGMIDHVLPLLSGVINIPTSVFEIAHKLNNPKLAAQLIASARIDIDDVPDHLIRGMVEDAEALSLLLSIPSLKQS